MGYCAKRVKILGHFCIGFLDLDEFLDFILLIKLVTRNNVLNLMFG